MRQNVRSAMGSLLDLSWGDAITALEDQIEDTMDGIALLSALDTANNSIKTYIENKIDLAIYQRPDSGYNDTYDRYVKAYNNLNAKYKKMTDDAKGFEGVYAKWSLPSADALVVGHCATPTGTCYGYYESTYEDWRSCMHKHGLEGDTDYEYWTCQSEDGNCPRRSEHWVPCRGNGCNVLLPPPTEKHNAISTGGGFGWYMTETVYHDHEVVCDESVYSPWGNNATCGKEYFTCQGGCQHRAASGIFPTQMSIARYATHNARVVTDKPYQSVGWHLTGPGEASGTTVDNDPGNGSTTEATFSYTFDSEDQMGQWTVTAYVTFDDGTMPQLSYLLDVTD